MKADLEEGTPVAKGSHVVPKGVAVEELDGGKKKLSEKCPPDLKDLLEKKDLFPVYDRLVQAVVDESATRSVFGKWQDKEFEGIIDLFRDDFAENGVRVALCKRRSNAGTHRWLEFIDVDEAGDYVPQFDTANMSGQVINTCYTKLKFPNGVAVEELKQYGKTRKKLKEKTPIYVEKLLTEKGLMEAYQALVDDMIVADTGTFKTWEIKNLLAVVKAHEPKFEVKGVNVFLGHKQEYISHGQYGGHYEYFRWLEFVDREEQPNYFPQRDAEVKEEKRCVVM